jgi:hypothetical protein
VSRCNPPAQMHARSLPFASPQEGAAKPNSEVRYVSCLFWVLSAHQENNTSSADGASRKVPSMHTLLKTTNTPVFDFFLQTSQLGKQADKLTFFKELLPPEDAAGRLLKAFTTIEVHFIILVILFSKLRKMVEDIVPEEPRRDKLHRASWLLFLNVQHVYKAFDMFPAFCLCVASLHAVVASAEGVDPCAFMEEDDSEAAAVKAARLEWSQGLLKKACAEQSVVKEVLRAASKVGKEWLELFGKTKGNVRESPKGKGKDGKKKNGGVGAMDDEVVEASCSSLSEHLSTKLAPLALAQLDGRILLDSPHLVERKRGPSGSSPSSGGAASAAEAISGNTSGPPSPTKAYSHQPLPGSPADSAIFRTPERPTRAARIVPPSTPITSMQHDHAWLCRFLDGAAGKISQKSVFY